MSSMVEPKFKVGDSVKLNNRGKKRKLSEKRGGIITGVIQPRYSTSCGRYFYITDGEDGRVGTWEKYLEEVM